MRYGGQHTSGASHRHVRFWHFLACGWAACWIPAATQLRADDWPQWLGPQRDSVWREEGIVEQLPRDGAPVLWRQPVGGGYAGPAVADGRVFVADYVTQGDTSPSPSRRNELEGTERIRCYSAADGKLLWSHEYDCPYRVSYPAGPRVTPTVDGDRVYCLGAMGNLKCLSVTDGKEIWQRDFKRDYGVETPTWGFCGHPLVDGDRLICLVGGKGSVAVAFDKHTGKEIWRALDAREPGYCPPTMIEAGGVRQLLIWHAESINSLDPRTGKVYWSEPLAPDYGMAIVPPRLENGYLFVGGIQNKALMLRLNPDRPAASLVWEATNDRGIGPVHSPPFLEGDFLYGVDREGELRCVRVADGGRLWSTYELTTGSRRQGSATAFLVKHRDRFFVFNEKGELLIARLTPQGYEVLSRTAVLTPTGDAFGRKVVWSHPAFAQRCMFARNDQELVCVSLAAE